jgi:predicted esterase
MSEATALDGPRRPAAEGPATALVVLLHGFGADAARGAGNDGNFIGLGGHDASPCVGRR